VDSTNVSNPCARFVARDTRGLLDTPTVVMPASAARSGHVTTASGRSSPRVRSSSPRTGSPLMAPWLRGWRPLRIDATEASVQLDCAIAFSNTRPRAASASSVGVGLGAAP